MKDSFLTGDHLNVPEKFPGPALPINSKQRKAKNSNSQENMIPLVENHSMHQSSSEPRIIKKRPPVRRSFGELCFRQCASTGFTSIELLVVIAIIAVLIALLVPAV